MDYSACFYMEKGLCFDEDTLRDCCIGLDCNKRGLPIIVPDYKGEIPDWNKLFEIKEKRNKYVQEVGIPDICEGCGYLSEGYKFTGKRKLSEIMYQNIRICNSRCVYCSESYYNENKSYNAYPATKELIKKGFFEKGGSVTFQGGEPTLMKDFDKIVDIYLKNDATIRVNSSGILYRYSIYKGIKKGNLKLVVSIDSGTKDLYFKIKKVDKFDSLVKNLKKYAKVLNEKNKTCLTLKYIIIPGINDSVKDIDDWFNLLKDIGVKSIILDSECRYTNENEALPDYIYYLEDYVQFLAKENNMDFDLNMFLLFSNRNRVSAPYLFENFDKEKFSRLIEEEKTNHTHKNLTYRN